MLKTRHWLIRKESYTQFPWEAFRLQIEKDLWIYVFRKPAETIHLFCGEAQAKMLFSLLCNWALRSIHQRLKATSKMKKKGLLYSNLKTKKYCIFCLYLCQICFISKSQKCLFFLLFLCSQGRNPLLWENWLSLFLCWKIFDHFQLLYTIGDGEEEKEEFSRHLWGITKLLLFAYCSTLESQSEQSQFCDLFKRKNLYFSKEKCLVLLGCEIQNTLSLARHKKDLRKVLGVASTL